MPMNCEMNSLNSLSSKFSDLKVIAGGVGSMVLSGVDKSLSESFLPDKDGSAVALKRLPLVGKGQCRAALRELLLLQRFKHDNIVKTYKITDCNGSTIDDPSIENFKDMDSVYVVEELLDTDLHKIIHKNGKISLDLSKLILYQVLRGLKYIHSANVIHRDIKPGNIFVNADDLTAKIGDYGLARVFDNQYNHKGYLTAVVSTRYYRAPEVMIDLGNYSYAIDIWSAGCVFAEMLLGKVLFSGENDLDQLHVICSEFGVTVNSIDSEESTFPQQLFEGFPPEVVDLLSKMLTLDPSKRITTEEALSHPFFSELHDPQDEPTCERPFFIEHEIDNLPIKILKRKILRNSCFTSSCEKKSYHSSEENLFKDFDETFSSCGSENSSRPVRKSRTRHFNSHGEETDSSYTNSSVESPHSSSIYYPTPKTTTVLPAVVATTAGNNNEDFFPSLMDAMSHEALVDEPFRDPGVCERKYHESSEVPVKSQVFTETSETSYFSGLSPVIDMSDPVFPKSTAAAVMKMADTPSKKHFLEIHGRSCADKNSHCGTAPNTNTRSSGNNHSAIDDRFMPSSKMVGRDIRSINNEILRSLNDRKECPIEALLSDKFTKQSSARPMAHWGDSLKFWI